MFSAIVLFSTWILLGLLAALISLPWTLLTGNVAFLYRTGIFVVRTGLRAAGVRIDLRATSSPRPRPALHLPLQPHLQPRPAHPHPAPPRPRLCLPQALAHAHSHPRLRNEARRLHSRRSRWPHRIAPLRACTRPTEVLRSGVHILSFVEGTRSRDGRLQPFKKGPFYLAMHSRSARRPRLHQRHREDDAEGKSAHLPRHGARRPAPAPSAPRLSHPRSSNGRRSRQHSLRPTGLDAQLKQLSS